MTRTSLQSRAANALFALGCIRQSRMRLVVTEDQVRQLEAMAERTRR